MRAVYKTKNLVLYDLLNLAMGVIGKAAIYDGNNYAKTGSLQGAKPSSTMIVICPK